VIKNTTKIGQREEEEETNMANSRLRFFSSMNKLKQVAKPGYLRDANSSTHEYAQIDRSGGGFTREPVVAFV